MTLRCNYRKRRGRVGLRNVRQTVNEEKNQIDYLFKDGKHDRS